MAGCFGKYGIDDLTNFNFTSGEYTKKKKYNNIYCNIRNDKDSDGNYKDKNYKVKNGKLEYVSSNEEHINITKAQYYYYYSNDCSCTFDLFKLEVSLDDCTHLTDISTNDYVGVALPAISTFPYPDYTIFGNIGDISLSNVDFSNIDETLYDRMPKMSFPTTVRFDNTFC